MEIKRMATRINGIDIGNGVNIQPSYYNDGNVHFGWDFMHQYAAIKTVRIEIEPNKANMAKLWIQQAQSYGYHVIATYHKSSVLGSGDINELLQAALWWRANYQLLGGNFIINLMNEWGPHNLRAEDYAAAYNQAISIIRSVYVNDIIIDLPGWGQDAGVAVAALDTTNPLIEDKKLVLSAHIYQNSWNGSSVFSEADIDTMLQTGLPCMVGEFGPIGNGHCDWSACVNYAAAKGMSLLGWCWNGDGEGYNMVDPYWKLNPLPNNFSPHGNYFNTIYDKLDRNFATASAAFINNKSPLKKKKVGKK